MSAYISPRSPRAFGHRDSSIKSTASRYEDLKSARDEQLTLPNYQHLKVRDLKHNVINNYLTGAKQEGFIDSYANYFPATIVSKHEPSPVRHALTTNNSQALTSSQARATFMSRS